ncbi:flagellar basal-body rod protein FlgB [Rhodopirellula sp. SWK7]|nr:flagellar basal-body rod protein FlgB [Rhodopirellula sp. SWK7]
MFNPLAATTIGALEQTIAFTERRHELLAGNIANLSTPDYRSRDLDVDEFQTALARSIRDPEPSNRAIENTSPVMPDWSGVLPGMLGHPILSAEAAAASGAGSQAKDPQIQHIGPTEAVTRDDRWSGPRSAMESIVYHDGSDVSLEEQVNKISKNKHLHNLAISTMRNQFDLLRAAITERA